MTARCRNDPDEVRTREGSAAMDDKPLDTQLERTTRNLDTGASRHQVSRGRSGAPQAASVSSSAGPPRPRSRG